ncbi:hypothetical protein ACIPYV_21265, partial [Paenarthrobacter nicotinovorans]|uniref:hypothetical protein n=1 Tax=Paenarthrobacter nicotinovorans TaxID=29320 RepID=UPI00380996B4
MLAASTAALTAGADPTRHMPSEVVLMSPTTAAPSMTGGTAASSATGWTLTAAGGAATLMASLPLGTPMNIGPAQSICVDIDIPDVSKINVLTVYLWHDSGLTTALRWGYASNANNMPVTLVNGRNTIRIPWAAFFSGGITRTGIKTNWGKPYRLAVAFSRTPAANIDAGSTATIRRVWAEVHRAGKMLIIGDRGYKSWVDGGYPALKALKVPVTWAPDLDLFGSGVGGIFEAVTEARMHELAKENGNSISFHGKTGGPTSGMTAAELAAETAYCRDWLRHYGYQGRIWRAAYVQNQAGAAADPLVTDQLLASRTHTGHQRDEIWPPIDQYDLYCNSIENTSTAAANQTMIDDWFDIMKATNSLMIRFFHRIDETDQFSTRKANWDYFVSKVSAAISEGWLEGVTFEDLFYGTGGNFEQRNGTAISRWTALPTRRVIN